VKRGKNERGKGEKVKGGKDERVERYLRVKGGKVKK